MKKHEPTRRCETCNKLVHKHRKCKYCSLLLHQNEKCDCAYLKIKKLLKAVCIICHKKHRGNTNKQTKRFILRGNWCRKCEIKANRNAANFTPTIIYREGFEKTPTIKFIPIDKPTSFARNKHKKKIVEINGTEYFYPNNKAIKKANAYREQQTNNQSRKTRETKSK